MTLMESMTKIFPVTVTKLRDPVTRAIKNISTVLYGLPNPSPSSRAGQDAESLVDWLQELLENGSIVWLANESEKEKRRHVGLALLNLNQNNRDTVYCLIFERKGSRDVKIEYQRDYFYKY